MAEKEGQEGGAPVKEKPGKPKTIEKAAAHANIFEALAAFQSENPEIKKTKEFGKEGEKMHWWYAPLDELLITVRPLTAKHGLSFTWEKNKEGDGMVCALYHETYTSEEQRVKDSFKVDGTIAETEYTRHESGVLRSMPIEVSRKGDMKNIGADSTYARRYTLAEVLAIAPDEDKDAQDFTEARREQAENAMFNRVKDGVKKAKNMKELEASEKVVAQNLASIREGKVPQLGLSEEQLAEIGFEIVERRKELGGEGVGKGAPGENQDAGGDATIQDEGNTGGVPPVE